MSARVGELPADHQCGAIGAGRHGGGPGGGVRAGPGAKRSRASRALSQKARACEIGGEGGQGKGAAGGAGLLLAPSFLGARSTSASVNWTDGGPKEPFACTLCGGCSPPFLSPLHASRFSLPTAAREAQTSSAGYPETTAEIESCRQVSKMS